MPDHPLPIASLESAITRFVRRAYLPTSGEAVRREADVPLERATYVALVRVAELDGGRLSDVAARLGLDTSTTSRHVRRLTDAGLVESRPDPDDGRARRLHLTADGHDLLARVREVRRTRLALVLQDWDLDEVERLAAGIDRLLTAFEADERAE